MTIAGRETTVNKGEIVMSREYITRAQEETRSYSRAVKVSGGSTIYLAGVGGTRDVAGNLVTAAGFGTQTRNAFDRLRDAIEAAGGTLDDMVTMTIFVTDPRHGAEFVKIRAEYFKAGHYPGSALITVAALSTPEMLIEIQGIAVLTE